MVTVTVETVTVETVTVTIETVTVTIETVTVTVTVMDGRNGLERYGTIWNGSERSGTK
jgi:hypothetical protein